jgi:hypothetical protein
MKFIMFKLILSFGFIGGRHTGTPVRDDAPNTKKSCVGVLNSQLLVSLPAYYLRSVGEDALNLVYLAAFFNIIF